MKKILSVVVGLMGMIAGLQGEEGSECCEEQKVVYVMNAPEPQRFYVGAGGGIGASLGDALETQFSGRVMIGSKVNNFRVEMEGGYHSSKIDTKNTPIDDLHLNFYTLMGNVYYDIGLSRHLDLYIGMGLGASWIGANIQDKQSERVSALGMQFMTGLVIGLDDRTDLLLGYRFMAPALKAADVLSSNNLEVGLKWKF